MSNFQEVRVYVFMAWFMAWFMADLWFMVYGLVYVFMVSIVSCTRHGRDMCRDGFLAGDSSRRGAQRAVHCAGASLAMLELGHVHASHGNPYGTVRTHIARSTIVYSILPYYNMSDQLPSRARGLETMGRSNLRAGQRRVRGHSFTWRCYSGGVRQQMR